MGVMRVIPVESAIKSENHVPTSDELHGYIDGAWKIAVTGCSCRRVRRIMGEGCGHLEEDMCIMLDRAADFQIKSGHGHEITKDEAYAILKRAEDNGLIHEVSNIDGTGKVSGICNCCECSCLSLRGGRMFNNTDLLKSNYHAEVDRDKCVACGQCVENCQMNALHLGQKLCSTEPLKIRKAEKPGDGAWGRDKWNVDWRENREDVAESGTAPCKTKCPAHIAVQGYIKLASQGKYRDALELIKKENPFPAICGRVCPRFCEDECTRGDIDAPIAIDEIKKFIAEQDMRTNASTKVMGMMASVRVSFTMVAYSSTVPPVEWRESQVEAAAVTEEVSFTAVPAKRPKPSLESPSAPPSVGKIMAAMTLKRKMTDMDWAISSSSAPMTGAVAAMALPPHMEEPTPISVDILDGMCSSFCISHATTREVVIVDKITGREALPTLPMVARFNPKPSSTTAVCSIFFDVKDTPDL